MTGILKLKNQIKHYKWGSPDIIPGFLGIENKERFPFAEMWMGTHHAAPSLCEKDGKLFNLEEISGALPFLLKLIAVENPLSIQVHPDREQAKSGFLREEEIGLKIDDPKRNYKDQNQKNEILYALTPFTMMAGIKKTNDIISSYADASFDLRELMERLKELYPDDPSVHSTHCFNYITLKPGQAVFLPAKLPHFYISGFGIELMDNSDNVIRAGLTSKYVDENELNKVMDIEPFFPQIITPDNSPVFPYLFSGAAFSLTLIHSKEEEYIIGDTPAIGIVTEGSMRLLDKLYKKGESFFVPSDMNKLYLEGNFSLVLACRNDSCAALKKPGQG